MKKGMKIFLAFLIIVSLAIGSLSIVYRQQLWEQAGLMAKQQLHRFLSVTRRLEDLQDTLLGILSGNEEDTDAVVVGGIPEDTTAQATENVTLPSEEPTETHPPAETDTNAPAAAETEADTETNTEKTPVSTDTQVPDLTEPSGGYTVKAHEGIIGVFDAEGCLIESVNVSVITLPEADRRALEEGIAAATMADVRVILDKLA